MTNRQEIINKLREYLNDMDISRLRNWIEEQILEIELISDIICEISTSYEVDTYYDNKESKHYYDNMLREYKDILINHMTAREIYEKYYDLCKDKTLQMGQPYLYKREISLDSMLSDEPEKLTNINLYKKKIVKLLWS